MAQAHNEKTSAAGKEMGTGAKNEANDDATANDSNNGGGDPIELLRSDHRRVDQLFSAFEKATDSDKKSELARKICTELTIHTLIEEEIFYAACRGQMDDRLLDEAQVEHDSAKALIAEVEAGRPDDQYFDAKVKVLAEEIRRHVQEEEKPGTGILAKAKQAGLATPDLAQRLTARKRELMEEAAAGPLRPLKMRSFRAGARYWSELLQEHGMSRSATLRERDESGRFVGDEDERRYRRRARYDEDDDRRAPRRGWDEDDYRRAMPPRDEEGRFVSTRSRSRYEEDDHRPMPPRDEEGRFVSTRSRYYDEDGRGGARYREDDGRRYARSRYYDEDDYRRGGRGHGGWYGDPEGHSEAARRGWEERGGGRYRDDDDDRRYARSRRDYEDDGRRGRR